MESRKRFWYLIQLHRVVFWNQRLHLCVVKSWLKRFPTTWLWLTPLLPKAWSPASASASLGSLLEVQHVSYVLELLIRIYILSRSPGELNVHSCVRHRKVISSCLYLGLWRYSDFTPTTWSRKELGEFLTMTEDQRSQGALNPERTHGQRKLQLLLITIYWNIVCTLCNSPF